jgi:tRNA-specific 2-thiouridylase
MFVVAIRAEDRAVVIGPREELLGRGVIARGVTWLVQPEPEVGACIGVRVRHRAKIVPAEIVRIDGGEVEVALDEPVSAIAPGQSLVMYDGEKVLGGGFIEASKSVRPRRMALPLLAG